MAAFHHQQGTRVLKQPDDQYAKRGDSMLTRVNLRVGWSFGHSSVNVGCVDIRMVLAVVLGVYYTVQRRGIIPNSLEWFVSRGNILWLAGIDPLV